MAHVVTLGGFLMTPDEWWNEFDDTDRRELLSAFATATRQERCDESYESYELTVEPLS